MFCLIGCAIIISLVSKSLTSRHRSGFSEGSIIMKIKLSIVKAGSSVGEVVLGNCANISNMVPDMVLTCLNIRDGYGFNADEVAVEWCGISRAFSRFLQVAVDCQYSKTLVAYDFDCWDSCWVSFSLVD